MEAGLRIPEKLFFRIGEVCELIKVQPHVLRYWETEFPMLAPQKNRAGQRVYRRRDVEMVMRIRDLLYEEKFTIAGAKKKLMEENRAGGSRAKMIPREAARVEEIIDAEEEAAEPQADRPAPPGPSLSPTPPPPPVQTAAAPGPPESDNEGVQDEAPAPGEMGAGTRAFSSDQPLSPQENLAIRVIKRDLEDLLTMLNSDVSINR
ncbi:MAG TPA: MerR family transcriptional regulator [Blastocatellia bacterium]|nr:MerR family transcriptional regulator [Blastocatellia bacterium]